MPAIEHADASTVVKKVLALCGGSDDGSEEGNSASSSSLECSARLNSFLGPFIRQQDFILHLGQFVFTNNLCLNVAIHPGFLDFSHRVHADLENVAPAKITPILALEMAEPHLQHLWLDLVRLHLHT